MSRRTQGRARAAGSLRVRGFHPLRPAFPGPFRSRTGFLPRALSGRRALQPRRVSPPDGLGSSPFARRYLGNLV